MRFGLFIRGRRFLRLFVKKKKKKKTFYLWTDVSQEHVPVHLCVHRDICLLLQLHIFPSVSTSSSVKSSGCYILSVPPGNSKKYDDIERLKQRA